jgi:xanthine/uracil/vitamin C permease (AzgA family)
VLYALSNIINNNGDVGYSLALTGVFIGAALLLLSAFWQAARQHIVKSLPLSIKKYLPVIAD